MDSFTTLPVSLHARLPGIFHLVIPYLDPNTLTAAARVNSDAFRLSTTVLWHTAPQFVVETVQLDSPFAVGCLDKVRIVDGSRNNTTSLPLLPPQDKVDALRLRCPNMTALQCTGSSQPPGFLRPNIDIAFHPLPSYPSSSATAPAQPHTPTGSIRRRLLDHWYYICSPRALDLPCQKHWPGFDCETEYGVAIFKPQNPVAVRNWLLDAPRLDERIYRLDILQGVEASLQELGEVCARRRKLGKRCIEEMQVSGGRGGDLEAFLKGAGGELRALIIELEGGLKDLPRMLQTVEKYSPGLKSLVLTIRASSLLDPVSLELSGDVERAEQDIAETQDGIQTGEANPVPPQLEHLCISLPDIKTGLTAADEPALQAIAQRVLQITAPTCSVRLHGGCEGILAHQTRFAEILGRA